jgi:cytochrome c551/c552
VGENQLTEFLHEVVNRREVEDFWNNIPVVPQARINEEATERLVQWLIDQQREEDNANV